MMVGVEKGSFQPELDLEHLLPHLSHRERSRFSLEMVDAFREDDAPVKIREIIRAWTTTVTIRQHPDFEPQMKNWLRIKQNLSEF